MKVKKVLCIILVVLLLSVQIPYFVLSSSAAIADEAESYELGVEYKGSVRLSNRYYKFTLDHNCHVSLYFVKKGSNGNTIDVISTNNEYVMTTDDIAATKSYSEITGASTYRYGKNLEKGTYFLKVHESDYKVLEYSFIIDIEDIITLPKGTVSSLISQSNGCLTAQCSNVSNTLGYEFEYTQDVQFIKDVKSIKSPTAKVTIDSLESGKYYYVRVRPYSVYTDGSYVYGQYSVPRNIQISNSGSGVVHTGDIILGDTDLDGVVTILDATAIQRYLANLPTKAQGIGELIG